MPQLQTVRHLLTRPSHLTSSEIFLLSLHFPVYPTHEISKNCGLSFVLRQINLGKMSLWHTGGVCFAYTFINQWHGNWSMFSNNLAAFMVKSKSLVNFWDWVDTIEESTFTAGDLTWTLWVLSLHYWELSIHYWELTPHFWELTLDLWDLNLLRTDILLQGVEFPLLRNDLSLLSIGPNSKDWSAAHYCDWSSVTGD